MNKKRLKIELIIIGAIILGILLWRFLPWFFVQPVPTSDDPYIEYKTLYNDVENYDFDDGPSSELESRINRALAGDSNPIQLYYNLKAKTEYYYHIGDYDTALETVSEAKNYAHTPSEQEYVDKMIEALKTP